MENTSRAAAQVRQAMGLSRQQLRQRGEPPPIYGRDRERSQLRELLEGAASGHGALVLISGEAGIGKTTLVEDLICEAERRACLVLAGGCYDLTTTPPYGPWSEALRDYHPSGNLPDVPPWFGNPDELEKIGSQTAFLEEIRRFLAALADVQPLIIILEDLHWADSATLDALRYLARTLNGASVLFAATYREDEITRQHELYQLLPTLVRESRPQRIHLNRLARHHVWELVTGRYRLPAAETERLVLHLSARSQGNPFFVEEILQGLQDDRVLQPVAGGWNLGDLKQSQIPTLLRQALDVRLARLSQETRTALRVAAVIGQIVPLDLWQTLSGIEEANFERSVVEALETYVLQEGATGNHLQFRHALFREVLYTSLTLSRRRAWHRTVGEALAEIPNADPDAVAYHFEESGDPRAARWLVRAGVRAEGSYAIQLAASKHDRAQALLAANPDTTQARGWLLLHIGNLLLFTDLFTDRERGLAYLEDAGHVARQVADPVLQALSQHIRGLLRCYQGEVGKGLSEMERAIAVMDTVTTSQEQRAQQAITSLFPSEIFSNPAVWTNWVGTLFRVGRLPGVNRLNQNYVDWLARSGRFHKAMRVGESFIDQVMATTEDAFIISGACRGAYLGLSFSAHWLGRPEEARRWRALALDAGETSGDQVVVRFVRGEELDHLLAYETTHLVERRNAALATTATIEGVAHHQLGGGSSALLDVIEGRWDTAREFVQLTLEQQDPYAQYYRAWIYRVIGGEWRDEGLIAAIQADIDTVLPGGPATEFGQTRIKNTVIARQVAAELALDAGHLEGAREWIEAHDDWLEWSGAVLGRADSHLLWARYHQAAGDAVAARRHAERALEHAGNPHQPLALIAAHRALGQLKLATAQFDQADAHLEASLDLAERCEAPYEQALTLLEVAELAATCGDTDEAQRLLKKVGAICESLGAQRTLDRATSLATELQAPPQAGTTPFGLTPRELEVLEAVAEGLTDAEAGERLSISTRTVSHHLRSIYSKLEINNRAAMVRIAMERELV